MGKSVCPILGQHEYFCQPYAVAENEGRLTPEDTDVWQEVSVACRNKDVCPCNRVRRKAESEESERLAYEASLALQQELTFVTADACRGFMN